MNFIMICKIKMLSTSLGGLEPPTFRLTAERASRLRHRDIAGGFSILFKQTSATPPGKKYTFIFAIKEIFQCRESNPGRLGESQKS